MIQPEEIREKAERLYPVFLKSWLTGDAPFFPRALPSNKRLQSGNLTQSAAEVQRLRDGSREVLGYGYTVEWKERRSRKCGLNQFPTRILFETEDDFLRFIRRRTEFNSFRDAVVRLRNEFVTLEGWIRANPRLFISMSGELDGLLHVLRYFRENPRPNRFARELPIPVETKFIERHERVLRQWLDVVLPADAIQASEDHFERRYSLRYPETHWLIRLLDPRLQEGVGFPCSEFSIPLATLIKLPVGDIRVVIVENKVNLLTLPPLAQTLALGGVGRATTELRQVDWLRRVPIKYWGDIDVEGFNILSAWRTIFPQTESVFMDVKSLDRFNSLTLQGSGALLEMPPHLNELEQTAFLRCRSENIRLEQERIPQSEIVSAIGGRPYDAPDFESEIDFA